MPRPISLPPCDPRLDRANSFSDVPERRSIISPVVVVASLMIASGVPAEDERVRYAFPKDSHVLNAKVDLGAKGDGVADDTDALQKGLDLSSGYQQTTSKVLFLPNGVYRVTKSLVVKNPLGPWMYGETRDGVIIKLADGSKGVTAVLRTHPIEKGPTSADWFMRNVRNLTFDAGNNPEADGVRWYATNSGILKNVTVKGNGKVGINAGFLDQSGPNLVQDCLVDGFETGVNSQWIWSETLSRVTVRNARKVGLYVSGNVVAAEDFVVENAPRAVEINLPNDWGHWAGVVALVGGRFTGGDGKGPAIQNDGFLYARNITTKGFTRALGGAQRSPDQPLADLGEWNSHPMRSAFDSAKGSLKLPIKREPPLEWETNPSKWVIANDHGMKAGDNVDDSDALQKAIDAAAAAGATTVAIRGCGGGDPNWYSLSKPVRVHGSVRHILGLGWARMLRDKDDAGLVVGDDSAPVVRFQNLDSFGGPPINLVNLSKDRTLVAESCGVGIIGDGGGDLFITDCPANLELRRAGQKAWCRQLNPEGETDTGLVVNRGGDLWILGMKNEGKGIRIATHAGGRTELLGAFNYGPGVKEDDKRPMFLIDNARMSVAGLRELSFGGLCYPVKVKEIRGGESKLLDASTDQGWIGWSLFSGSAP